MSAKTCMIIMDSRDIKDNLSSRFKSADVITSQIGNTRCTACEQAVNKYTIRVEKKIIGWTFFTFSTCSASFNNARFSLLSWKKRMTVQNVGKNSLIWGTFLVFGVLILLIVPSAAWEVHLTEGKILIWKGVMDLEQTNHQSCLTMQLLRDLTLGTNLWWFNFANGLN